MVKKTTGNSRMGHERTFANSMSEQDCIVIGTGIIGLSAALALSLKEKVLLVGPNPQLPPNYSVCAINQSTQSLWNSIGLWKSIEKDATPISHMLLKGTSNQASLHAISHNRKQLGWIIPNAITLQALTKICEEKNIEWIKKKPTALSSNNDHVSIEVEEKHVQSKWAIAADGRHSWTRQQLGIYPNISQWDQNITSMNIHHQHPHNQTAIQCFLPTGPMASLPLSDPHTSCLVWSHSQDNIDDEIDNVQQMFPELGKINILEKSPPFPLTTHLIESMNFNNIAFIGDAAHTVHPIAGLGMNLGMIDIISLLKTNAHDATMKLEKYHRTAYSYQSFMTKAIHSTVKLSRSKYMDAALLACQKDYFLQQAMIDQANGQEWL